MYIFILYRYIYIKPLEEKLLRIYHVCNVKLTYRTSGMSVSRDRHIRVFSPNVIVSIPHIDAVDTLSGVFRGRCSADHVKTVGYHVEGGKAPR